MDTISVIGVDLGGTNMRAGKVINGKIAALKSIPVPKTNDWHAVLHQLIEVINDVWTTDVKGIGIGVPGLVDSKTGMVYDLQNIPSWVQVPVAQLLSNQFNVPVYVNNDANCFAAGERFFGAGQQYDDFVGLITGTGLGAGIIKSGHLMQDQNCGAGEFGMIPYLEYNYEYYASGQFFTNVGGLPGGQVAELAATGQKKALELFNQYGYHLANTIKCIIFAIDPAAIILGGSVSNSFEYYKKSMFNELATFPYSRTIEKIVIKPSEIKDVAILGAAGLFHNAVP